MPVQFVISWIWLLRSRHRTTMYRFLVDALIFKIITINRKVTLCKICLTYLVTATKAVFVTTDKGVKMASL